MSISERKRFPIQVDSPYGQGNTIGWSIGERIYEMYSSMYPGQTIEQMAARGGFGVEEIYYIMKLWVERNPGKAIP